MTRSYGWRAADVLQAGQEPAEFAAHWHEQIKKSFDRLNIAFDNFSRTSREVHTETTLEFFEELIAVRTQIHSDTLGDT